MADEDGSGVQADDSPLRRHRPLLWLAALSVFMLTLDSTIVNTALPGMAVSLRQSPLNMQWVVVAYMLAIAVLIPASGWLVDRLGLRRVFLAAIVLFTLGSLLCALSPSLHLLVASRVAQGLGGALLLPLGRLVVMRVVPREHFLEALSFIAIPGLVGPVVGPVLGGWLVQALSWHWIFLINVPMGVAGWVAARRLLPEDVARHRRTHFDFVGYLMIACCMLSFSMALDGLSTLGFQRLTVMLLMFAGVVSLVVYGLHATRVRAPLYSPRLFRLQSFRIGVLGNLFARIGGGALPFMIPLLLQVVFGYPPSSAGMMLLPMGLASLGMKRAVTPLVRALGYRRVLVSNTLALGALIAVWAWMDAHTSPVLLLLALTAGGAASSLQFTCMNTVTLKDLRPREVSSGNSLHSMVQMLAMSFGVSVAASLLSVFRGWYAERMAEELATLRAFQASFICIGVMTACAAGIFWHLDSNDGRAGAART